MGNCLITNLATVFEATSRALNKMKHSGAVALDFFSPYILLIRTTLFVFKGGEVCIYCLSGECLTYQIPGSFILLVPVVLSTLSQ